MAPPKVCHVPRCPCPPYPSSPCPGISPLPAPFLNRIGLSPLSPKQVFFSHLRTSPAHLYSDESLGGGALCSEILSLLLLDCQTDHHL